MRKKLIALAIAAAASSSAVAQMNVTVTGRMEVSIDHLNGQGGSNTSMRTGQYSGQSNLTFKGTEDLGGGMKIGFNVGSRFSTDGNNGGGFPTGTGGQAAPAVGTDGSGLLGSTQTNLTLTTASFGDFTFGRFGNASGDYFAADYDPFKDVGAGGVTLLSVSAEFGLSAVNNAIRYRTPVMGGFQGIYEFAMSEHQDKVLATTAGSQSIFSGVYNNGPLSLMASRSFTRDSAGGSAGAVSIGRNFTATGYAASYDFGAAKLMGQIWTEETSMAAGDTVKANDLKTNLLGVEAPMGAHTFKASYRLYDDRRAVNQDTTSWTLGYDYKLSKRSLVWVTTSQLTSKSNTPQVFLGGYNKATQVGLRHTF